jgi:predicted small integral membrane protein
LTRAIVRLLLCYLGAAFVHLAYVMLTTPEVHIRGHGSYYTFLASSFLILSGPMTDTADIWQALALEPFSAGLCRACILKRSIWNLTFFVVPFAAFAFLALRKKRREVRLGDELHHPLADESPVGQTDATRRERP